MSTFPPQPGKAMQPMRPTCETRTRRTRLVQLGGHSGEDQPPRVHRRCATAAHLNTGTSLGARQESSTVRGNLDELSRVGQTASDADDSVSVGGASSRHNPIGADSLGAWCCSRFADPNHLDDLLAFGCSSTDPHVVCDVGTQEACEGRSHQHRQSIHRLLVATPTLLRVLLGRCQDAGWGHCPSRSSLTASDVQPVPFVQAEVSENLSVDSLVHRKHRAPHSQLAMSRDSPQGETAVSGNVELHSGPARFPPTSVGGFQSSVSVPRLDDLFLDVIHAAENAHP